MARLFLVLLLGVSAASTASIFIKLSDAPALIIAAYRMVFASLLLLPFACHQKVWKGWSKAGIGWLLLSGVFLSLHFAFWIGSLKYTSVASSVVLVSTHPIFVGLGSWLFLRERLGVNLVLGIGLSVLGSGLISFGDLSISREALAGDGLALLGAMAVTGYFLVGRKMRRDQDLLSYIFSVYSTAGIVLVIIACLFRNPLFGHGASNYFLFFLLALIPQLIGHTSFNWALKYIPASLVAITVLGEPVGSTLLAYFILGEGLSVWKMLGGLTIFMGILVALRRGAPDSKQPVSENAL